VIDISSPGLSPGEILARRLAAGAGLDRRALADLGGFGPVERFGPGAAILEAGTSDPACLLVVAGAVAEVRTLDPQRRQLLRLRLPGDLLYACDREDLVALGRVGVADARAVVERLHSGGAGPAARRAWFEMGRADQRLLRDQLVRLGRLSASERVAHFLLETRARLQEVRLVEGETFHLPATQAAMSDLLGLSSVHLSRTLHALRGDGLIGLRNGRVVLLDRARLERLCGWIPAAAPARQAPIRPAPEAARARAEA